MKWTVAHKLIKNKDKTYYDHYEINEIKTGKNSYKNVDGYTDGYTDNLISIVMTTHNRAQQTYYTLNSIKNSILAVKTHIIIVDDSKTNKYHNYQNDLIDIKKLEEFGLYIDYIVIKNKFWVNSCVNYNLGFSFIKGSKTIIQNAEVCHIGDVISYVDKNLSSDNYLVFDVIAMADLTANNIIYSMKPIYENYDRIQSCMRNWYQHSVINNVSYHFLTSITTQNLMNVGLFDFEYATTICYDDNNLISKIKNFGLTIKNVVNNAEKVMGIHLWHYPFSHCYIKSQYYNKFLFDQQEKFYKKYNKFFILFEDENNENENDKIEKIRKLCLL